MNLAVASIKRYLPELNKKVVSTGRILEVFGYHAIEFYIAKMEGRGCCVTDTDTERQFVFLNYTVRGVLFHETLGYEATHILIHEPAPFMKWRHEIEAEFIALMMMMPLTDLPRLNRIKHQLDDESYEYFMRRLKGRELWRM